jgi:thymidine kinase
VKVVTHEGLNADALPVADAQELVRNVGAAESQLGTIATSSVGWVVGIDEAQFFGDEIVAASEALANRGARVVAAGLDQDYRGEPFGPMPRLMAVAEYVTKLHAVCAKCGAQATRSQRIVASESQLFVGGAAAYEARCRRCFVPVVVGD